jgi:hypothetical protein
MDGKKANTVSRNALIAQSRPDPEVLGGAAAGELLRHAKAHGLSTSVDILAT